MTGILNIQLQNTNMAILMMGICSHMSDNQDRKVVKRVLTVWTYLGIQNTYLAI